MASVYDPARERAARRSEARSEARIEALVASPRRASSGRDRLRGACAASACSSPGAPRAVMPSIASRPSPWRSASYGATRAIRGALRSRASTLLAMISATARRASCAKRGVSSSTRSAPSARREPGRPSTATRESPAWSCSRCSTRRSAATSGVGAIDERALSRSCRASRRSFGLGPARATGPGARRARRANGRASARRATKARDVGVLGAGTSRREHPREGSRGWTGRDAVYRSVRGARSHRIKPIARRAADRGVGSLLRASALPAPAYMCALPRRRRRPTAAAAGRP